MMSNNANENNSMTTENILDRKNFIQMEFSNYDYCDPCKKQIIIAYNDADEDVEMSDVSNENKDNSFKAFTTGKVKSISKCRKNENSFDFLVNFTDRTQEWINDNDCNCESLIRPILHKTFPNVKTIYLVCRSTPIRNRDGTMPIAVENQQQQMKNSISNVCYEENVIYRTKITTISQTPYNKIPNILQEISNIAIEGDVFAIYRADRLTRNPSLTFQFIEDMHNNNIKIYSAKQNMWYNNQKIDFIQFIIDANRESEILSVRIRDAFELKKKRGDIMGRVPFGKKRVKKDGVMILIDDENEKAVYDEIIEMLNKNISTKDIANIMNSKYTMRGRKFTTKNINVLIQNFNKVN